jgi:hypothetical protein
MLRKIRNECGVVLRSGREVADPFQGASLDEIGELLGHRSAETAKIYTKVDLDALRTLALPWPGGAR